MPHFPPAHLLEPLNSRQRLGLLLIDEVPDRVVVYPLITSHAAAIAGIPVRQYCTEGQAMAAAQLQAWRFYKHDAISIFSDVALIAEALGSRLYYREEDVPVLLQPALDSPEAGREFQVPSADSLPGRYAVYLEAISACQREVGDVVPVMAFIPAPFTTAALLRGTEDFLVDTLLDPKACHTLLAVALQAGVALADLCIEAGAIPLLVDPLASASVISPEVFANFAQPYLRQFSDHLHRYDFDVFLHICGRTEAILPEIQTSGCDLFSCDEVSLHTCKERLGDSIRLIGNLRPTDLLDLGANEIQERAKAILLAAKDNPRGFILSTGCEVPLQASPENVAAFVQAGRRGGLYWGQDS